MYEMEPRERILCAMRRQVPDRVPREAVFTLPVEEEFRLRTYMSDYETYFGMDRRWLTFRRPQPATDFSPYLKGVRIPERAFTDEWGNLMVKGPGYRTTDYVYPMRNLKTPADVAEYPFPDFRRDECHTHLDAEVKSLHDRGLAATGDLWGTFFEKSWHIRGMDNLFYDFADNPDFANALLDKMLDLRIFMATRYAEAGVDILATGDDLGIQHTLLMSVPMWRKWFKPRLAKVWAAARRVKPDIIISYHSDGFIEPFIPELIEIGLDVLNPVQPECMDPAEIKRKFGDRLAFFGTVGTQTTLPFGSPDEVRRVVRERIETVGKGGGLVLAPSHFIEPDVPWENVLAFFEAAEEYGHYR
jgi:uroporphyrinogen decarboxylase